eukprot:3452734-Pyramimonas_sp.AAC.1
MTELLSIPTLHGGWALYSNLSNPCNSARRMEARIRSPGRAPRMALTAPPRPGPGKRSPNRSS